MGVSWSTEYLPKKPSLTTNICLLIDYGQNWIRLFILNQEFQAHFTQLTKQFDSLANGALFGSANCIEPIGFCSLFYPHVMQVVFTYQLRKVLIAS